MIKSLICRLFHRKTGRICSDETGAYIVCMDCSRRIGTSLFDRRRHWDSLVISSPANAPMAISGSLTGIQRTLAEREWEIDILERLGKL